MLNHHRPKSNRAISKKDQITQFLELLHIALKVLEADPFPKNSTVGQIQTTDELIKQASGSIKQLRSMVMEYCDELETRLSQVQEKFNQSKKP